jgi:histidyl-tRNA synthetase
MSGSIQAVRGMNDILPEEALRWEALEAQIQDWLHAYGYRPVRMPLVERTELFVRSIGAVTDIVEKEMYTFVDQLNGESLTLRPEGTASCVRAALEHNLLYGSPQRLYYGGAMFRHERPQKGRYRQFHQVGVEALGYAGPDIDAEHIVMTARLWRRLGLGDLRLELGTLGSSAARTRYRARLVRFFGTHADRLDADAQRRLHSNPLRILDSKNPAMQELLAAAPRLLDDLDEDSLCHFDELQALLRRHGVEFTVNPRLVRGLDYYNRTVFEWTTERLGAQGTVCAGGRYDGLVEQLGGKAAPACGFAMGLERLLALVDGQDRLTIRQPVVYVVHQGAKAAELAPLVAEQLRDAGLSVVLHCGEGSFKSQMKKADVSGAAFAVIIGDDEAAAGEVSVKPLRTAAEQVRVAADEAPAVLQAQAWPSRAAAPA